MPNANKPLTPEDKWLAESGLTKQELPGKLVNFDTFRSIDYYDIDGVLRPKWACKRRLTESTDPKAPKLLCPEGLPPHLYYPQCTKTLPAQPWNWRNWAATPKVPKLFAEGAKKAALATKFGFPAVGLLSNYGWKAAKHGRLWLEDFDCYDFKDCDVYLALDRDRKPETVAQNQTAAHAFASFIKSREGRAHVVELPLIEGLEKTGLDDYLMHYSRSGKDVKAAQRAFEALIKATGVWDDWEISDLGASRRWAATYCHTFQYMGKSGWYRYANGVWRPDEHAEYQESCKRMFEEMVREASDGGNSLRAAGLRKHATARCVADVTKLAQSDPKIANRLSQANLDPYLVNAQNGTLELPKAKGEELRFRPAHPEDMLTKQLAAAYNPKARCPIFLAALRDWTDKNAELMRTIQQLAGLSLSGVTKEEIFIIVHGPGGTGKSRLVEILRYLLADYAVALTSDTFLLRKHGKEEERKMAPLPGARFASACETEKTAVLDTNLVKLLTGEDTVTARHLYKEQFSFMPQAKIWLRTNNLPKIRDTDGAMWRRVVLLPFNSIIPAERKDRDLPEKLKAEAAGILNWMLEGYADYVENGLVRATVVNDATSTYEKEQDLVAGYFGQAVELGAYDKDGPKPFRVGRGELHNHFLRWCGLFRPGSPGLNAEEFKGQVLSRYSKRIVLKKLSVEKKQNWYWTGLRTLALVDVMKSIAIDESPEEEEAKAAAAAAGGVR